MAQRLRPKIMSGEFEDEGIDTESVPEYNEEWDAPEFKGNGAPPPEYSGDGDEMDTFDEDGEEIYDEETSDMMDSGDLGETDPGLNSMYRNSLQQANMYFNPVMDTGYIPDSLIRGTEPPGGATEADMMGLGQPDMGMAQKMSPRIMQDQATSSLLDRAQARATASRGFQNAVANRNKGGGSYGR
jgi:hypothetical protein